MDRAFAYVSCSEEDSRVKVQKYCRKIYELGYIPICPRFGFVPFLDESNAEDQQGLAQMSMLLLKRCRMVVVCGNEVTENMNTEISTADRLHIICTTLEGLIQIKEMCIRDRNKWYIIQRKRKSLSFPLMQTDI